MANKCEEVQAPELNQQSVRCARYDHAGPSDLIRGPCWEPKHKIFLSHSGAQKDFTEQLCKDLERVHHFPFFDKRSDSLPKGEKFPGLILEAATQCRVAVLVLSEEFFTRSKWPMTELSAFVQAQQSTNPKLKILPLFLELKMSQMEDASMREGWVQVWQNWAEEDERIDVKKWVHALSKIPGGINAMEYDGGEGHVTFRERVVAAVCKLVPPDVKWDVSHVRSMERLCEPILQKMKEVVEPHKEYGVRVVGLYGIGGVGKTTISKALCNQMFGDFDGKVFHAELGVDKNLVELRKNVLQELTGANEEILSNRDKLAELLKSRMHRQRLFLSLDNVWDDQIEEAQMYLKAGYQDGSIMLVTTRSLGVLVERLRISKGDCLEMPQLLEEDAMRLFLDHAAPHEALEDDDWETISTCVKQCYFLKMGSGHLERSHIKQYLPLALKVLGSQLRSISDVPVEWKPSLRKVKVDMFNLMKEKRHPIHSILRLGYDALLEGEQHIFLDLALLVIPRRKFFNRHYTKGAIPILEWLSIVYGKTEDDIKDSLKVLWRKALLDDLNGFDPLEVRIHDLYLDFAKEEARAGPLGGSRFLIHEGGGVPPELKKNQLGSLERLIISHSDMRGLNTEHLHHCPNVKVLQFFECEPLEEIGLEGMDNLISVEVVGCVNIGKQFVETRVEKLRNFLLLKNGVSNPAPFLGNLSSLTALQVLRVEVDIFSVSELVFLPDLSGCINLRNLTLSGHRKLKTFPDVSALTNLKTINFYGCENASGISASSSLSKFWWKTGFSKFSITRTSLIDSMRSLSGLQELNLAKCWGINDWTGLCELMSLQKLIVSGTNIYELPDLRKLKQLQLLDVSGCRSLRSLVGIAHSTALRYLYARWCGMLRELPDQLSSFEDLQVVDLSDSGICTLPNGYRMLAGRGILKVGSCIQLIEFLVKELERQGLKRSHDCVPNNCVSSCEQSSWDSWRKDKIAYHLFDDVLSVKYDSRQSWDYMLNYGEKVVSLVRALCEHNDMGTLSSVLAEYKMGAWWVVVATAPGTFGVVTEKAMVEPSWENTLLHYTLSKIFNITRYGLWTSFMGTWSTRGMVAVLGKCREQLLEESNGIDPVLSMEGKDVVDTLLRECEALNSFQLSEGSILDCTGCERGSYRKCFPNFPFGPTLAKQTL